MRALFVGTAILAMMLTPDSEPTEDSGRWDCRFHGNQVCGPTADYPAGAYQDGTLVQPWGGE